MNKRIGFICIYRHNSTDSLARKPRDEVKPKEKNRSLVLNIGNASLYLSHQQPKLHELVGSRQYDKLLHIYFLDTNSSYYQSNHFVVQSHDKDEQVASRKRVVVNSTTILMFYSETRLGCLTSAVQWSSCWWIFAYTVSSVRTIGQHYGSDLCPPIQISASKFEWRYASLEILSYGICWQQSILYARWWVFLVIRSYADFS